LIVGFVLGELRAQPFLEAGPQSRRFATGRIAAKEHLIPHSGLLHRVTGIIEELVDQQRPLGGVAGL
jgi:hypothetical protein